MSEEKKCKKCSKRNATIRQILMGVVGFYVLGTSIYGTIQIIHNIIALFK
jgi:hypothetical protein